MHLYRYRVLERHSEGSRGDEEYVCNTSLMYFYSECIETYTHYRDLLLLMRRVLVLFGVRCGSRSGICGAANCDIDERIK